MCLWSGSGGGSVVSWVKSTQNRTWSTLWDVTSWGTPMERRWDRLCFSILPSSDTSPAHPGGSELGLVLLRLRSMIWLFVWTQQLFQKLKNLMRPYSVEFESPLELSAQGGSVSISIWPGGVCAHKSSFSALKAKRWLRCISTSVSTGSGRRDNIPSCWTTRSFCDPPPNIAPVKTDVGLTTAFSRKTRTRTRTSCVPLTDDQRL